MNNMHSFFSRLCHAPIPRCAAVLLVALDLSSLAFGGEIHDAAKNGDLGKVKALLESKPVLLFSKDTNGWTPLHYAASEGRKDAAELLLANKADVDAKSNGGWTPLHWAASMGQRDVAVLLLANNADVNAKDSDSETPLHKAANWGHKDVAKLLLTSKAEVNAKDNDGMTPLHKAAAGGLKDVAELLLANGAQVNAKDIGGQTPLHMAADIGLLFGLRPNNLRVKGWPGARESPDSSAQAWPERSVGVWSPLGSSACGCPCNPWSNAKNSSFPQLAARWDNLSHIRGVRHA
jgi:ankyrin repeat protein